MKKLFILCISFLALINISAAQTPTYAENVATIIYNKCAKCHHEGAIAPFSLMNYTETFGAAVSIADAVNNNRMPPWPPDHNYTTLAHQRILTQSEIQTINDWVAAGSPEGNPSLTPTPPVFNNNSELTSVDLTLQMETYEVQSPVDEYRCFVIPSTISADKFIQAMEVIPGNRSIVHHVLVFYDTSGICQSNDAADPLPGYSCFGGANCNNDRLVGIWVPGAAPQIYPNGMGVPAEANGDFIIQVHYAPGSQGQKDSTKLNLKFATAGFTRPVYISAPLDHLFSLTNGPLIIPANTTPTFYSSYTVPTINISVLAIGPHMHLIGNKIKSYGFDPAAPNDTIRFIDIPRWDFKWQGLYFFPKVKKISSGTILKGEAKYDNTTNNPLNPNNPPQLVTLGEGTTEEMMLIYFAYTYYLPGDENIVQDPDIISAITEDDFDRSFNYYTFPNPSFNNSNIFIQINKPANTSLYLYDLSGRTVHTFWNNKLMNNSSSTYTLDLSDISTGLYLVDLVVDGKHQISKFNIIK